LDSNPDIRESRLAGWAKIPNVLTPYDEWPKWLQYLVIIPHGHAYFALWLWWPKRTRAGIASESSLRMTSSEPPMRRMGLHLARITALA
jgi:hypothetical protein